jgi:hypothetical protein
MSMATSRVLAVILITIVFTACGGSDTSPSPGRTGLPLVSAFEGTWTGAARLQCGYDPAGGMQCDEMPTVTFVQLTLTPTNTGNQVEGVLRTGFAGFVVSGSTDSSGALVLTGLASAAGLTATLMQSHLSVSGGALTGTFTFTSYRSHPPLEPPTLTGVLEGVTKAGSPESTLPFPAESRISMHASGGFANRWGPSGVSPGATEYGACANLTNAAPIGGRVISVVVTPIGPDGREYTVERPMRFPYPLKPAFVGSACETNLRDYDYRRPIATTYRLRLEYEYDDGVTGAAEVIGPIKVSRDTVGLSAPPD